jgi:hypothetical protein
VAETGIVSNQAQAILSTIGLVCGDDGDLGAADVCGGWLVSPTKPGRINKFHQLINA